MIDMYRDLTPWYVIDPANVPTVPGVLFLQRGENAHDPVVPRVRTRDRRRARLALEPEANPVLNHIPA